MELSQQMEPLSLQIYNTLATKDFDQSPRHRQRAMWIWNFLLSQQPAETLQVYLHEIEEAFHDNRLENHQLLELSWKAESIELLLRELEPEPVMA